jgi:nucleotide-binding universal stress UspA family protein
MPADQLVDLSERVDLLVLGSRAWGPVRRIVLGSVSAGLTREAHCPVLVLPRGDGAPASPARGSRRTRA